MVDSLKRVSFFIFSLMNRHRLYSSVVDAYDAVLSKLRIPVTEPIKIKKTIPEDKPMMKPLVNRAAVFDPNYWFADLEPIKNTLFLEDGKSKYYKELADMIIKEEPVSLSGLVTCIHDSPNGLLSLNAQQQWAVYSRLLEWPEYTLTRRDFHKFMESMLVEYPLKRAVPHEVEAYVVRMYTDMKKNGIEPDSETFKYLYRALKGNIRHLSLVHSHVMGRIQTEKAEGARFSQIVCESSVRTLLAAYVLSRRSDPSSSKFEYIDRLWFDIKDAHVDLSIKMCIGFLQAFQQRKDLDGVMRVHKILEQRKQNNPWNRHVSDALMEAYGILGSQRAVKSLFFEHAKRFSLCTYVSTNLVKTSRLTCPLMQMPVNPLKLFYTSLIKWNRKMSPKTMIFLSLF